MPDSIPDASVALSLMLEALRLLDGLEHSKAAAHLRDAINELSPQKRQEPSSSRGAGEPGLILRCAPQSRGTAAPIS